MTLLAQVSGPYAALTGTVAGHPGPSARPGRDTGRESGQTSVVAHLCGRGRYPSRWQRRLPLKHEPFLLLLCSITFRDRCILLKGSLRGDPPPVTALTETDRATADPKAARAKAAGQAAEPPADSYSAKHLSVLEGLDAVRKRPGMYIGSTDGRGLQHCLWEIFDNAVDEALGGFCTRIEVILHADGSAEVRDNGRGIPVDTERKTKLSGVELVMTRLHAGGKFGGGSYTASGGLHGVGASVVNALSSRLDIEVDREGVTWTTSFRRGVAGEFAGPGPGRRLHPEGRAAPGGQGAADADRHPDQVLARPPGVPQGRHVLLRRPRRAGPADRLPGARPGHRRCAGDTRRASAGRRRRSGGDGSTREPSSASRAASASSASTWAPARRSPRSSGSPGTARSPRPSRCSTTAAT